MKKSLFSNLARRIAPAVAVAGLLFGLATRQAHAENGDNSTWVPLGESRELSCPRKYTAQEYPTVSIKKIDKKRFAVFCLYSGTTDTVSTNFYSYGKLDIEKEKTANGYTITATASDKPAE